MNFQISGLDPAPFAPLFDLDDAVLQARGIDRCHAGQEDHLPCRVSLEDAAPGDELLLLHHAHLDALSPYRAAGPIYVRRNARERARYVGHLPPMITSRLLSVRAYDARSRMVGGEVVPGAEAQPMIERFLENREVEFLHLHFGRRGCYAALVERLA